MTTETKIKHAKLPKNGESFEVTYTEKTKGLEPVIVKKEYKDPVHGDMSAAFSKMRIHLAVLAGYLTAGDVDIKNYDETLVEDYHCSSFSVSKNDDKPGVVITGTRKVPYGSVTLNSPFIRFDVSDESAYVFRDDLAEKLEAVAAEVRNFVFDGKRGEPKMPELPFEKGEPITNVKIDHPADAYTGTANTPEDIIGGIVKNINDKIKPNEAKKEKPGSKKTKKVPQSAAAPSGEAVVNE